MEPKLIGIYSSRNKAEDASKKFVSLPGFRERPLRFLISRYEIGVDHWVEGFRLKP